MTATIATGRALEGSRATTGGAQGLIRHDTIWFASTYENNVDSVYRYALMLVRDADRAEDVTADVFLKAWHGRRNFRGDGTPLSWLLAITHNSAMSALRSERNNADIETIPEPCDPGADPAGQVDAEIDAAVLREAIRQLTPEQQQVILLRFFQGLPHEQVAARLERNPNAVRAIQFRALSRLRKLLEAPVASTA